MAEPRVSEGGFVLVWMATVLVVLLGVAAFAVDLVHAYAEGQHLQNALDASALAGAVEIPAGDARASARSCELLRDNYGGADPCSDPTRFSIVQNGIDTSIPNQMDVEAKVRVKTFFARIMGIDHLTVRKRAEAQYDPPLQMGSPANNLGDVPAGSCPGTLPAMVPGVPCAGIPATADQNLWAQIQGRLTNKTSGNSFTGTSCGGIPTDGCDFGRIPPNTDFDANHPGEYFSIVNDVAGSTMRVFIFDAQYTDVGSSKNVGGIQTPGGCGLNIVQSDGITTPPNYAFQGPSCTGDQNLPGSCGSGCDHDFTTTYELLKPDGTPSPFDNDTPENVVCSPPPVPGQGGWAAAGLAEGDPHLLRGDIEPYFEQWWEMCTIRGAEKGEYVLHVTADANSSGANQFSILALHDGNSAGRLQVFSRQRLPLFATKNPASPIPPFNVTPATFYLARVLPSPGRDRTLQLNFFDLGDSAVQPPTFSDSKGGLTVVPRNASFPSGMQCAWAAPPGFSTSTPDGPPWGTRAPPGACSIRYDRSTWNAQWVTVNISVPKDYSCITSDPNACWIQLRIDPDANTFLSDATTWTATMLGSPVRLVG